MRIYSLIAGLPVEVPACFRLAPAGELSSKVSEKPPKIQIHLAFPEHLLCVKPGAHSLAHSIPLTLITTSESGIPIPILQMGKVASSRVCKWQ